MVDVIIPVLNEERILTEHKGYFYALGRQGRLLFVDGGSTDKTVELAGLFGEVVVTKPGRGHQKNKGAAETHSPYLLFLHVDAFVEDGAVKTVEDVLNGSCAAGCFTMSVDDRRPVFRIFERLVNWRAEYFGVVDGDLGMFVRRDLFDRTGGFDDLTIMDDIAFSRKMRKHVKITRLNDTITVSSRKWNERGFGRTLSDYTVAYVKYWTGWLKKDYEQQKQSVGRFCKRAAQGKS